MTTVFVGGMTRSGSTWAFNVTRAVIRAGGKIPIPEEQEQLEDKHIQQAAQVPAKSNEVYCIKTHHGYEPFSDDIKLICNYRDVRAAGLSYMRFMRCDFAQTLQAVQEMMDITDFYYQHFKPENALYIRYDTLIEAPLKVVNEIGDFLGINLSVPVAAYINQKYSKKSVEKLLKSMQVLPFSGKDALIKGRFEPRECQDGGVRAYDRRTSFQAGHITSAKEGEWREAFSQAQQDTLNALCVEWLQRHHFTAP